MALVLADRVRETTTTAGTGTITLLGAVPSCQSFAVIGNGNTTYYTIVAYTGTEYEVGIGTYTSSGTTLSRDTVLASSNGGSLVNFSAGTKDVFCDYPADKAVTTDTLAYPPAIGGTTPAAGTFTTLTGTGNTTLGSGSVNWVQIVGSGSGGSPYLYATGGSSAGLDFYTNSSLGFKFRTNNGTNEQARVSHTASAVNYVQVTGAATGGRPTISGQGSDANVDLNFLSKGTSGGHIFTANNAIQAVVSPTASAVNYVQLTGATTGGNVQISAQGTDSSIGISLVSKSGGGSVWKGDGGVYFQNNAANNLFSVENTSSTVNRLTATGSVTGSGPRLFAQGSDTNIDINLTTKGTGTLVANLNSGYFKAYRDSGTNTVQLRSNGNLGLYAEAGGAILFNTNTAGDVRQMQVAHTASAVNYLQATGSVTGSGVTLSAQGSDTNIDINLIPKGTGTTVYTGGVTINGTLTAQNEVLKGTGQNLTLQSQTFANAAWGKSNASITSSTATAPDSTSTACTLIEDTATTLHYINQPARTIVSGTTITLSAYVKANGRNFCALYEGSAGQGKYFNITAGGGGSVLGNFISAPTSAALTYVGNDWYRISIVVTSTSQFTFGIYLSPDGTSFSYTGNGTSGINIWGAQTELGSTLNTYIPTTTTAVYGTPTLSFSGVSTIGLESNGSLFVQPAGTGALQAQATTSSAVGGNARGANAVDWQTSRSSANQVSSGTGTTLSGGVQNIASNAYTTVGGGVSNGASGFAGVVSGGWNNYATGNLSVVSGGYLNTASGTYAFIGSGQLNTSAGYYNFIGGGFTNSGTSASAVTTQSGTMNGTTAVTLSGSNANIKVGQYISGTSIAGDTYVAAISGTSLTLSKVASGSSTSTLSFFTPHGVVVGGGNNQATGSYSFIGGGGDAGTAANRNVASGDWSTVAGGRGNLATNPYSTIAGGQINGIYASYGTIAGGLANAVTGFGASVLGGYSNLASGSYSSIGTGTFGTTRGIDSLQAVSANGPIASVAGVSQSGLLILGTQTTDATATVLRSNTSAASTTNQVILPNNSAYYFKGSVIANVTGAANGASWSFEGAIMRGANAASTVLIGTPAINRVAATAGATAWTIALTADTTNGGLAVTVTGAASTTIRFVAKIETTEVTF